MIPAAIVPVEAFPLTTNGKIDRKALPKPDWASQGQSKGQGQAAPQTEAERILVDIWSEVLGVEVGIHDNFFELGGDSILSIQIIARAKQAGLAIAPRQLFQNQTVAELAVVAGAVLAQTVEAEQGAIAGAQEWLPIYHWFFEQSFPNPHHFNQSLLLELQPVVEPAYLSKAWATVVEHHDALRLKFSDVGWVEERNPTENIDDTTYCTEEDSRSVSEGETAANPSTARETSLGYAIANPTYGLDISGEDTFSVVDIQKLSIARQREKIATLSNDLQASLDLSDCLSRCVLFNRGKNQTPCLLIIVHHLVVDGLSWRSLLADLNLAYQQLKDGGEIALSPKTTSFQAWGEAITYYAQSPDILKQQGYWQNLVKSVPETELQIQNPAAPFLQSTTEQVTATLDEVQTQSLLTQMPSVFNTRVDEVMLTALVQILGASIAWGHRTGAENRASLVIDLEGHGRDVFDDSSDVDLDVSRTVGWFTSIFPVMLTLAQGAQPGDALKSVKEQLRQIPCNGTGYGVLRYLHPDAAVRQSVTLPRTPDIKFNYLGQMNFRSAANSIVAGLSNISPGTTTDPIAPRLYALDITSFVQDGRLQTQWNYSGEQYLREDIEQLVQQYMAMLQSLIRYGQNLKQDHDTPSKEYTPSDFAAARLNQQQLDQVLNRVAQPANNPGAEQNSSNPSSVPQRPTQSPGRQRRRRR